MRKAISNTSPILYLYRVGVLDWLGELFEQVWIPPAVAQELREGQRRGFDVPEPGQKEWIRLRRPKSLPSEWLVLDLGPGELSTMALALENPGCIVLLDDLLARRTAKAAGLTVWGTLRVLLEAKRFGLTDQIAPYVDRLSHAGMWLSEPIRLRILALAGE